MLYIPDEQQAVVVKQAGQLADCVATMWDYDPYALTYKFRLEKKYHYGSVTQEVYIGTNWYNRVLGTRIMHEYALGSLVTLFKEAFVDYEASPEHIMKQWVSTPTTPLVT